MFTASLNEHDMVAYRVSDMIPRDVRIQDKANFVTLRYKGKNVKTIYGCGRQYVESENHL